METSTTDESRIMSRRVRSASIPGRTYLVEINLDTRRGQCRCPGYLFRGRCRHVSEMLDEYAAAPPE